MKERGIALTNAAIGVLVVAAIAVAVVALVSMDPTAERGPGTGRRYVEQAATAEIDPQLLRWRERAPLVIDLEAPCDLTLGADGALLVLGERLVILERNGRERLRSAELPADPSSVVVDHAGLVHIAYARHVRSYALVGDSLELRHEVAIAEPGAWLNSLAVTSHGLYVADAGRARVLRIAPGETPPYELYAKGFFVPSELEIATGPGGELLSVDPGRHKVQVRDVYGDVLRQWGEQGEAIADLHGCCNPAAVALMPGGRVATAEKGLVATRVKVYSAAGELESVVAPPAAFDVRPEGPPLILDVAVDAEGNILVLDPARKQVRVFSPKEG